MKMATINRFKKVKNDSGEEYLCNIDFLQKTKEANFDETEDCFEADVAGRYASNIEVVR